ncbi:16490_t:CDS:2, partial [Acaulospora colombiana]
KSDSSSSRRASVAVPYSQLRKSKKCELLPPSYLCPMMASILERTLLMVPSSRPTLFQLLAETASAPKHK